MAIYTRKFGTRYTPPPGYDGNTFSDRTKHHAPEDDLRQFRDPPERRDPPEHRNPPPGGGTSPLIQLYRMLDGVIGSEELLLLLVLLIVASNGIGPEVLILSVLLLAGGEKKRE